METFEHIADKYGVPLALVVWMFWRDYIFLTQIRHALDTLINAVNQLTDTIRSCQKP